MANDLSALDAAQAAFDKAAITATYVSQPWSTEIVRFLTFAVLGFTCVALVLCTVLLWRMKSPAQQVLKVFGVLTILGMSALLLVVGYSNEQLTPIVGLFGAVAGYLLGKDTTDHSPKPPT
jgi:hypothetical protein